MIDERRQKKEIVNASRTRREKQKAMEECSRAHKELKKSVKRDKEIYLNGIADKEGREQHLLDSKEFSIKCQEPFQVKEERQKSQLKTKKERPSQNMKSKLKDPPTREEIRRSVRQLNSGKAAGLDQIPPEALKVNVNGS